MSLLFHFAHADNFIFVTSDDGFVQKTFYDPETLEPNEKYTKLVRSRDKLFQLSNYVIGAYDGFCGIGEDIAKQLMNQVENEFYLDDCKELLADILRELNYERTKDKFFNKYIKSEDYVVTLSGFYRNGRTGIVLLTKNRISAFECEPDGPQESELRMMYTAEKYLYNHFAEIFDYTKADIVNGNHFETVVNHLAAQQGKLYLKHPETASSTFIVKGFLKQPDGWIIPVESEFDIARVI